MNDANKTEFPFVIAEIVIFPGCRSETNRRRGISILPAIYIFDEPKSLIAPRTNLH